MKNLFLLLFLTSLFTTNSFSQCTETTQPKVLLVGDSWAFFMNVDRTINNVFRRWGHSNYTYITNTVISENGAETDDFLKPDKIAEIKRLLNENPSIEVVHLSIGGNDVLGDWKVSFTQAQTDSLKVAVENRLIQVIDTIKSAKPGIKIFWSGYVYPNFNEVIQTSSLQNNHPFYGTWSGMEFPSFLELNTLLNDFSGLMEDYANADPQIEFVNCTGLMQYTFGQNNPLGVAPGGTYAAGTVPLPAGDPNYPSPANSMRDYFLTKDCFHLSARGYEDFIGYHTQKFYHKFLMDDLYLLSENNTQTGTVTSLNNVYDSLLIGGVAGEQFATALSFNTTAMQDTTVAKASIFLRRLSLEGNNPVNNNLEVRIVNGKFGPTYSVDVVDFSAIGNSSGTPCVFGSSSNDGHWVRLDLPASALPFIKNNEVTQFLITSPATTNGKMAFYPTTDPDFAPVLNITYGESPSLNVSNQSKKTFKVYPNPANENITIATQGEALLEVSMTNLLGATLIEGSPANNVIDISSLPAGTYLLNITTAHGKASQRVMKY
jgi:hypothetical protein